MPLPKKLPPRNFVSSLAQNLSANLSYTKYNNGVQVNSQEDVKTQKQAFLSIVQSATSKFSDNLQAGNVELTSTLDLERLVKMFLVLSGEASDIQGHVDSATGNIEQKTAMSRIEEIIGDDDPAVLELFSKLYEGYNQLNDDANEEK